MKRKKQNGRTLQFFYHSKFLHGITIMYFSLWFKLSFTALGAAYGTAKSGTGIAAMSVMRPELIMKSIIPVVMAGIIAIYGLVVAVLIAGALDEPGKYTLYKWVRIFCDFSSLQFWVMWPDEKKNQWNHKLSVCYDKTTVRISLNVWFKWDNAEKFNCS